MKRLLTGTFLISLLACATVSAEEIAFGDFGPGGTIYELPHQDKWELDEHNLNQWYTTIGTASGPLFSICPDYHATVDPSTWDDDQSGGAKAYSLLQVIEAPVAGDYNFSYSYLIEAGYEEASMVTVIGITENAGPSFTIHLNGAKPNVSNADSTVLYGSEANLTASDDWQSGGGSFYIGSDYTHIAILTWFEWDDHVGAPDLGQVDDFELSSGGDGVPEPGTLALVGTGVVGALGLWLRRRQGVPHSQ